MPGKTKEEVLVGERGFDSIFSYDAGAVRSRFLTELRDNRKIVGTRCPNCNKVYVPARSTCLKCFTNLTDFVEVGTTGTLLTYTFIKTPQPYYPFGAPSNGAEENSNYPRCIYGIIQLDGADTGFVHLIRAADRQKVRIGMRLKAVFKKERQGSVLDIEYFVPAGK